MEHKSNEHGDDSAMGSRGVTRMQHEMHEMSHEQRHQMMVRHHRQTLWIWWLLMLLGFWLILTPLTFDYSRNPAVPSGGRGVWLPLDARAVVMFWNDIACGLALVILGWRMLTPGRPVTRWIACFLGIWLTFAPLIFWSPSPLAYLNDTFAGALVIAFTILIPGMPNMIMMMKMGPDVPPGWSYNPSSWPQRWIMIALAFAGWMVSRYLAAFQLGYIDHAWDPFFGAATMQVLNSDMSHTWPISDGGLGALSYTFEFLMGWMGSPARWRTMPWMVLFFGILVVPLGLTHIFLVISQPVVVGQWCTLCLLAAAIMLPMIPLTLDEVTAMCQFMYKAVKRDGNPFWRTFWKGGTVEGEKDTRSPELADFPQRPLRVYRSSIWGVSAPWNLVIAALLGLWLMFSPWVFGTDKPAANSGHLAGALIVCVAVVAMAEVVRAGRLLNVLLGLWLLVGLFVQGGASVGAQVNSVFAGLALLLLSIPRGKITERYGSWHRYIF